MEDIEQLRKILLGPEREALDDLREKLQSVPADTEALAGMLPDAIRSSHDNDPKLAKALQAPVSECLQETARTDPQPLVDALFPVIGPAIRKSIAESMREFNQAVNQAIEHSVSPKGIRWRLEALRTGVPFSDIVMRNTLRYRVERVFLVHRESGLLVEHVAADDVTGMDSDAVSGMLSAIDSFVRDSFMQGEVGGDLDSVDIGEYTLWIVHGPHAVLACAIRGVAPAELRQKVSGVLEEIHAEYGSALDGFAGDKVAVVGVENYLERCLFREQQAASDDAKSELDGEESRASFVPWILAAALLTGGAIWLLYSHWIEQRVDSVRAELDATPGIVVTDVYRDDDGWTVRGLRDPLATEPNAIAERLGASAGAGRQAWLERWAPTFRYDLRPYYSLEPELVAIRERNGRWVPEQMPPPSAPAPIEPPVVAPEPAMTTLERVRAELQPPPSVAIEIDAGVIELTGDAGVDWLRRAESQLVALKEAGVLGEIGVERLRTKGLVIREWSEAQNLKAALGAQQVFFDVGSEIRGTPATTLDRAASLSRRLIALSTQLGAPFELVLTGFADGTGDDETNTAMKIRRAEVVREALVQRDVPRSRIVIQTGGSGQSGRSDPEWRRVDFEPAVGRPPIMNRLR